MDLRVEELWLAGGLLASVGDNRSIYRIAVVYAMWSIGNEFHGEHIKRKKSVHK